MGESSESVSVRMVFVVGKILIDNSLENGVPFLTKVNEAVVFHQLVMAGNGKLEF